MVPRSNPSHQATHQPGRTKAALSQSLLALLYMSQDALLLCVHIFLRVSLSLSISLCLVLHLSLALPLSHWWFVFLLWDLGSHSFRVHCSALIHSSGWASRCRMGDCGSSRLCLRSLALSLSFSPQLLATPLLAACHTMMSWLLFAPGVPIDSISPLHTLYISPVHPALSPTSTPVFLSQSPSQILSPLKRRLGDLGMFGCCLAHPRYMLDTQIGEPSTLQIQLQLPLKSHWFNVALLFSHLPLLWSAFISLWLFSLFCFTPSLWSNH